MIILHSMYHGKYQLGVRFQKGALLKYPIRADWGNAFNHGLHFPYCLYLQLEVKAPEYPRLIAILKSSIPLELLAIPYGSLLVALH